jgi:peptidoglycan/LPS O-acetylase OafA/YrhL
MSAGSQYRADIDGLRALAVGTVLVYHAFPAVLPGGFVGVDVFFAISGYLISGIILDALRADRFSLATFYARRIRRIFPALTTVLVAVLAIGWVVLYADDYARLGRHAAAGAAFLSNFELWNETSYFDVGAGLKPLLHLWSLGIEEQFYLVWPLLLLVAARWRRGPIVATIAIGIASFAVAIWTVQTDRTAAFYAPWTRFWELLSGATLACVTIEPRPMARNAMAVAGILMIAAAVMLLDAKSLFPGYWALLPVFGTCFLIAAGANAWINRTMLSLRPLVWIGLISYPLYLWHWPLLSFATIVSGRLPAAWIRSALLIASVVLSWITYQVIERPIRFQLRARLAVPALGAVMAMLYAAGITVNAHGGFVDRALNRSDAAHLVDYYDRMSYHSLGESYRFECDFNDRAGKVRPSLPASCTERGTSQTVLWWGDSFAQALSQGLRENLPAGTSLAQVATSSCRAQVEDFDTSVEDNRCEIADRYAMRVISDLRPDVVILAQNAEHLDTDWAGLTGKILELGGKQVVVVGPSPMWEPTLPRVYATHHMQDHADYVSTGLYVDAFDIDRQLAARIALLPKVRYISLMEHLCRDGACLARVPAEGVIDLMAIDYGHLSPKGSSYIGRTIWKDFLETLLK